MKAFCPALNGFIAYLRGERGATENTIASYGTVLNFAEWFKKPLPQTKRNDLQSYLSELLAVGDRPAVTLPACDISTAI
jgi:site-specific recombinase XerD